MCIGIGQSTAGMLLPGGFGAAGDGRYWGLSNGTRGAFWVLHPSSLLSTQEGLSSPFISRQKRGVLGHGAAPQASGEP